MTTAEREDRITRLEARISSLREQMNTLLSKVTLTPAQKQAVKDGHQWAIEDVQETIDALKRGENP